MAVAVLAASLPACLSPVPLDPTPQADLDPKLLGSWRCLGPGMAANDETVDLTVANARDRVYAVTFGDTGDETPDRYEVHASRVGSRTVLNVKDLSGGEKPWDFVEHQFLRPRVLLIRFADDDPLAEMVLTPAVLRAQLAKPDAFVDFCVCVPLKTNPPWP